MPARAKWDHDVFVSYSRADEGWVHDQFVKRLRENGVRVHTDREFLLGLNVTIQMQEAVKRSRHTVLIMTPDWLESEWANVETTLAVVGDPAGLKAAVIPILRRPCKVPDRVRHLAYANFTEPVRDDEYTRLVKSVKPSDETQDGVSEPDIEFRPAPAPFSGDAVSEGLRAVREFLARDDVRDELPELSVHLDHASRQIVTLIDYKKVHDLLHHLQLNCYDQMLTEQRAFPDDSAVGTLSYYADALKTLIAQFRETGRRSSLINKLGFVDDLLQPASVRIAVAIETRDEGALREGLLKIDRVLAVQPENFNGGLKHAADELRLKDLVEAIQRLCQRRTMAIPDATLRILREAMKVMTELDGNLAALVNRHDKWQNADCELRHVAVTLRACVEDFVASWPDLQTQITALLESEEERDPLHNAPRLDAAIVRNDREAMVAQLRNYRREFGQRFFKVDLRLLWQCEELHKRIG